MNRHFPAAAAAAIVKANAESLSQTHLACNVSYIIHFLIAVPQTVVIKVGQCIQIHIE